MSSKDSRHVLGGRQSKGMGARRWRASSTVNVGSEMTAITRLALFVRVIVASHCRTTATRIRIGLGSRIVVKPPDAHVRSRGTERSHSKQTRRKAVPWRPSSRRQRDARGRSVPKGDGGKRSQELVPRQESQLRPTAQKAGAQIVCRPSYRFSASWGSLLALVSRVPKPVEQPTRFPTSSRHAGQAFWMRAIRRASRSGG
ncbi:MAG: hypothetical protein QOJ59_3070 [Thermomicrobiales bacterium]|nr:hypothetical protein [Thermomicrobiales bacterium]